ncbi:MAG: sulfatase-like hydrolase/transferase [Verrucomicrobia bacterium]|nr:sulfatase-like hydrolase/transferase [Verrucomicrobiota bacterium]
MAQKDPIPEVPPVQVNYLFFGAYFIVVALLHVLHTFLIEPQQTFSTYFFATYALLQSALETLLLVIGAYLVRLFVPRLLHLYVFFAFFLFLTHLIDVPLVRLMDMSFWYAFDHFVLQESYENFIELLLASNVSLFIWMMAGLAALGILIFGIVLHHYLGKQSHRRPWCIPFSKLVGALSVLCFFLFSWDYTTRHFTAAAYHDRFQKTLPWKSTLFTKSEEQIELPAYLQEPKTEEELMGKFDSRLFSLARKPDIYLFVVESLREDYIDSSNAPHLSRFREENISFDLALSNANATHISWLSLFYSQYPFYWGKIQPDEWKGGSIPLRLLKKMGYKIHVSSSARLGYYRMNRMIFGEGEQLASTLFVPEEDCGAPYVRDQSAMNHLFEEMGKTEAGGGRLFVVFLDATHFDYSWPEEETYFYPFENRINYLKAALTKSGLEGIKNRYRNAIRFIDSQVGHFLEVLQKTPGGEEAVVVFTADHGEEFYEHGNLFHASGLSHPQTHIPLYYRFGQSGSLLGEDFCQMTSHMDVFPTLFHYIVGEDLVGEIFQGESIFKEARWPYVVVARFNASRSPYQFYIHNGTSKLVLDFTNQKDIFQAKHLKILSTKNCKDENLCQEINGIHEEFGPALDRLFSIR